MQELIEGLNNKQKEAVLETEGPCLVIAGAGSGKTKVLTHKIAYLIAEKNIAPWNILAITFTNKAANEMKERIEKLVGDVAKDIWMGTFHSICVRILRKYIDRIGFDSSFLIFDTSDQRTLVKECLKSLNIDDKMFTDRSVLAEISNAKNEMLEPNAYSIKYASDFRKAKIGEVYTLYQKRLKENNAIDFDDIINYTIKILTENPDALEYYTEKFKYVLVDEYQDTNKAQFTLVTILASRYGNITVVGDNDQGIYSFRGADISNILNFEKDFPGTKIIKLEQNYRCTGNILKAANAVIKNNETKYDKKLWTENEEGNLPCIYQGDDEYDEARYIVEQINHLKTEEYFKYSDYAILYRMNSQSRAIEDILLREDIPYKVIGGLKFYERKEIKDTIAYLRLIANTSDNISLKRIINEPKRGIGKTSLDNIEEISYQTGLSMYEVIKHAEQYGLNRVFANSREFVDLIEEMRSKKDELEISELIKLVLNKSGYTKALELENTVEAETRLQNIEELLTVAMEFEEEFAENSLNEFLESITLSSDVDNLEESEESVTLMTLHSAKGLEFPVVFMPGVEEGLFPSYMAITDTDPTAIEEERRLAYVGITRAKKILTISCARARMLRGEMQYNPVSRFVREIDEALMDNRPLSGRPRDFDFYEEDSPQKLSFKSKPFSTEGVSSLSAGLGATRPVNAVYAKPKAIVRPKKTELENQPFITKGVGALQKGAAAGEPLLYGVGDRVSHIKYGLGTVTAIEKGPRDYQVTVQFDSAGQKVMYAAFAKLKKVD